MLRLVFSTFLILVAALTFLVISTPPTPPSQPIQFSHKLHLDYFQDGRHRRAMVSLHEQMLEKASLKDDEAMERVEKGSCTLCHRDFDENAEDMAKLARCGECHRAMLGRDWEGRSDQRPCMGCHSTVGDSPQASIPNINSCAACHQPPLGSGLEEPKLLEFLDQKKAIPWARVYDYLPGDTIFSHERHVELGRINCRECHGPVERADRPLSLQVKLSMEDCMACHERTRANNDCLACHK